MVEVAAAVPSSAASDPKVGDGMVLWLFEELLNEANSAPGERLGLGKIRRCLLASARHDLARRLQPLCLAHRAIAHTDTTLAAEIASGLAEASGSPEGFEGSSDGDSHDSDMVNVTHRMVDVPQAEFVQSVPLILMKFIDVPQLRVVDKVEQVPMVQVTVERQVPLLNIMNQFTEVEMLEFLVKAEVVESVPLVMMKFIDVPQVRVVDKIELVPTVQVTVQRQVTVRKIMKQFIEVQQVEFVDKVVLVPVQKQVLIKQQQFVDVPQVEVDEKVVYVPVQEQIQVPMVTKIQKMVEMPLIEFVDLDVHVPVHMHLPVQSVSSAQRFVDVPLVELRNGHVELPAVASGPCLTLGRRRCRCSRSLLTRRSWI